MWSIASTALGSPITEIPEEAEIHKVTTVQDGQSGGIIVTVGWTMNEDEGASWSQWQLTAARTGHTATVREKVET